MNDISRRKFILSSTLAMAGSYLAWGNQPNAEYNAPLVRSKQIRLPDDVPPVIGAWFPQESEMHSEGYRKFIDAATEHSHYNIITTSMRNPNRQMVDQEVHDWFKEAAIYAKKNGIGLVLEVDPRHSVLAFKEKYPEEMQGRLWLKEFDLDNKSEILLTIRYDEYHNDAISASAVSDIQMVRVYCYKRGSGEIESGSVLDITDLSNFQKINERESSVIVKSGDKLNGNKICVVSHIKYDYPSVFSPHLIDFESEIIKQYSDLPLAGLMKDEWGFPACVDGNVNKNGYWYCPHLSKAYTKATEGRDLIRDSLLMFIGEEKHKDERQAVINQLMELYRLRNTEIDEAFYANTKNTFGSQTFVGTHATTFPYPGQNEFERNGLDWWTATRDYAQSDETTPYCCRTSMMKKFGGAVWYNQWYDSNIGSYEKLIWSYALAGGRMNFHILFPPTGSFADSGIALFHGNLIQADCRIRLLNFISDAPLDCPVAVIFGHACAMNWSSDHYDDVGMKLADEFWKNGFYTDLIPSSEIGSLRVDDDGYVCFGKQKYCAVILYHPEFEGPKTAAFFQNAISGKTFLSKIGDWTMDFYANPYNGDNALPAKMTKFSDISSCVETVITSLKKIGVQPQTKATITLPKWRDIIGDTSVALPSSGTSYLTDGTVICVSGENDPMGDAIQKTLKVYGHDVTFDAIGLASVRLTKDGELSAMAAGGLKTFKAPGMTIELQQRMDIALWKNSYGKWQGVLQSVEEDIIPESLTYITKNWLWLSMPLPLLS